LQPPDLQTIKAPSKTALSLALSDGSSLVCEEFVRVIPNKRLVCRGVWHQKTVYAKIFIGKDPQSYAARDEAGVKALQFSNIATPNLLRATGLVGHKGHVLIFEAIEKAQNTEEVWAKLNQKQRLSLAKKLVQEIAEHHNAGLIQTDLYLKNFLLDDAKIYTLDGDGIRQYTKLSEQQALQNLSVLLSKFDVLELEIWFADLLKAYAEARGWQAVPDATNIKKLTNTHRQKVASNYANKKVFRQCTDVNVARQQALFTCLSSQYPQAILPKNLSEMNTYFIAENLLKSGNTCTVALAEIAGKQVVVKRYNIKGFWHGISRALRQTRAAVSWANAHRLMLLDIATANPVALIEHRNCGLKGKAYFLAEYVDAPDATQFFAECADKTSQVEAVKNTVTLFYKLYLLKISHGDMKATNIKIIDNKPVLIDLDSMIQHRFEKFALNAHARDLRRFMQNWQNEPALYNAFVKAFKVIYADNAPLKLAQISEPIK
jgi:tRNA A-37 threonylcarbamoyl transferase component Bud32